MNGRRKGYIPFKTICAVLVSEPWYLSIDQIKRLTPWQVNNIYFHPRHSEGRRAGQIILPGEDWEWGAGPAGWHSEMMPPAASQSGRKQVAPQAATSAATQTQTPAPAVKAPVQGETRGQAFLRSWWQSQRKAGVPEAEIEQKWMQEILGQVVAVNKQVDQQQGK